MEGEPLTVGSLLQLVLGKVGAHIDCDSEDDVDLKVEGFVRFNDGQPVMRVKDSLTFNLKLDEVE